MPVVEEKFPSGRTRPHRAAQPPAADDGARALLLTGFWILLAGVLAVLAAKTVFGGIGMHGPHTNSGWLALIVAMGCLPFGTMLFLLGAAKWIGKRAAK